VGFEDAGLAALVRSREGHFRFESGHHGTLWLDLDTLFLRPALVAPYARRLAERMADHRLDVVCGPWSGGAFLAQMIAAEVDLAFVHSQPADEEVSDQLYARSYSIPIASAGHLAGKRIAVVDDVINAGSAVTATLAALAAVEGQVMVVASLMTLGSVGLRRIAGYGHTVETLEARSHEIWPAARCPLCAKNVPLQADPSRA
jgi:orotate phosphoribosyltransferase